MLETWKIWVYAKTIECSMNAQKERAREEEKTHITTWLAVKWYSYFDSLDTLYELWCYFIWRAHIASYVFPFSKYVCIFRLSNNMRRKKKIKCVSHLFALSSSSTEQVTIVMGIYTFACGILCASQIIQCFIPFYEYITHCWSFYFIFYFHLGCRFPLIFHIHVDSCVKCFSLIQSLALQLRVIINHLYFSNWINRFLYGDKDPID